VISRIASLLRMQVPDPTEGGLLLAHGASVPADATYGYKTGCIFIHTDGGNGTSLYVNEGTLASCNFNALEGAGNVQLTDLSDVGTTSHGAGKILVADGSNYQSVAVTGDVSLASGGGVTIQTGAVEDSMIEGLAAGQFIIGVDGTAANNAKVTMGGHATMNGTGAVTLATVSKTYAIPLTNLRKSALGKDALGDAPDATDLGLADAIGSPVVGTTTNGGSTATATEKCSFDFAVPPDYVAGNDLTVRINALVSAARNAASPLDVVAKLIKAGALDATDLCTTSAIDMKDVTTAADENFAIDNDAAGDVLAPGSVLHVEISFKTDDTAATNDGYAKINAVTVLVPCYR